MELSDERVRVTDEEGHVTDEPAVLLGRWQLVERSRLDFLRPGQGSNLLITTAGQRAIDQASAGALDRRKGPLPPGLDPLVVDSFHAPSQEALRRPEPPTYEEGEGEILVWPVRDIEHDGALIEFLVAWMIPGARGSHRALRTSIHLTNLPADPARHDAIVRACWRRVGAKFVTEDGQPSTLRLESAPWTETHVVARLRSFLTGRTDRKP